MRVAVVASAQIFGGFQNLPPPQSLDFSAFFGLSHLFPPRLSISVIFDTDLVTLQLLGRGLGGVTGLAVGGAACLLGHCFPIYFKFKGGKAVSAGAAVGLMIDWRLFVILVAVFGLMALVSKRASVCSMACAVVLAAGTPFFTKEPMLIALAVFTGLLVLVMHRANIRRLLRGEEPPFHLGSRKK